MTLSLSSQQRIIRREGRKRGPGGKKGRDREGDRGTRKIFLVDSSRINSSSTRGRNTCDSSETNEMNFFPKETHRLINKLTD